MIALYFLVVVYVPVVKLFRDEDTVSTRVNRQFEAFLIDKIWQAVMIGENDILCR